MPNRLLRGRGGAWPLPDCVLEVQERGYAPVAQRNLPRTCSETPRQAPRPVGARKQGRLQAQSHAASPRAQCAQTDFAARRGGCRIGPKTAGPLIDAVCRCWMLLRVFHGLRQDSKGCREAEEKERARPQLEPQTELCGCVFLGLRWQIHTHSLDNGRDSATQAPNTPLPPARPAPPSHHLHQLAGASRLLQRHSLCVLQPCQRSPMLHQHKH